MDGIMQRRIGNPAHDAVAAADALYRTNMALGSSELLRAIRRTREGKAKPRRGRLLWDDGSNGGTYEAQPDSANSQRASSRVLAHLAEKERVRLLVIKRDPCPRCGTRGDIGCEHQRVA